MKIQEKVVVPSTTKTIEYELAPCIKCDSDDLKLSEYEDQYGPISTVSCNKCKSKVERNTNKSGVVKAWNAENDLVQIIDQKTARIPQLREEIAILKAKLKQRRSHFKTT